MTAIETAAREELAVIVADLHGFLDDTNDHLRQRGVALAQAAESLGYSLLAKRITYDELRRRPSDEPGAGTPDVPPTASGPANPVAPGTT